MQMSGNAEVMQIVHANGFAGAEVRQGRPHRWRLKGGHHSSLPKDVEGERPHGLHSHSRLQGKSSRMEGRPSNSTRSSTQSTTQSFQRFLRIPEFPTSSKKTRSMLSAASCQCHGAQGRAQFARAPAPA